MPARTTLPSVALLSLLVASIAYAGLSAGSVQSALDADDGWNVHKLDAKGGVDVYKKEIAGLDVPGFKGVKTVSVDSASLFDAIIDIEAQAGLSEEITLIESHVLARTSTTITFWQYLDVPGWTLANDRYWFLKGTIMRDVGGVTGHHKWTWAPVDSSAYPEAVAKAMDIDDDAVEVSVNHGSWEVVPKSGGTTELIYRVVSNPGGRLPKSAQSLATGTTLPDNLLQFEAEAKRRASK